MINYLAHVLGKPISGRKTTVTVTQHVNKSALAVEKVCKAIGAALADEAALKDSSPSGRLTCTGMRSFTYSPSGANYVWAAQQYMYFARAIPEAFGYVTSYTDRGTVIVTTDAGEYICEFRHPKKVEGIA